MRTIHKYEIDIQDTIIIRAPFVCRWLHFGVQHGTPTLWGEVDTETPERDHVLLLRGTGHRATRREGPHIGTIMLQGGNLVLHLFETTEGQPRAEVK